MTDYQPGLAEVLRRPWVARWAGVLAMVLVAHGLRSAEFVDRTFNPDAGHNWQWDFESYYYAMQVHRAGGDPYDRDALMQTAGNPVFPFAYPPHTLAFFSLFDGDDLTACKWRFLVVKLAAVAATLGLWTLGFIPQGKRGWFLVLAALGFNATIARDLTAGNVCAFEQLPLWIGVAALLRGRTTVFCAMVLLAAQFKLQPLALLALLWFQPVVHRWRYVAAALGVMVLIFAGMYVHDPTLTASYFEHSTRVAEGESGLGNPSGLKLWTELLMMLLDPYELFSGVNRRHLAFLVFPMFALAVLVITFRALPKDRRGATWVYLGIATYALTAPRMKDYSWSLMLVPAFELLRRVLARPAAAVPMIVIAAIILLLPMRETMWIYRPYLLTFMLWASTIWLAPQITQEQAGDD